MIQIHQTAIKLQFADGLIIKQNDIDQFKPLLDWAKSLQENIVVTQIMVQSIDYFGPRIGFMKIQTDSSVNGSRIPGIVFLRGSAVAIFPLVNDQFVLLTEQYRVPIGRKLLEIPAGMTDGLEFKGTAIKELEEETGLKIQQNQLINLGQMIPSAGGCDEIIQLYGLSITLSDLELNNMQTKTFGESEHEVIRLKMIELSKVIELEDAKAIIAYSRWQHIGFNCSK